MGFFTIPQEKRLGRVRVMRDLIADIELINEPCPLLESQLKEMLVFTEQMSKELRKLIADPDIARL